MSGDIEKGKQWIDGTLQRIRKEYSDRITIEKHCWKYEPDRLSYSLYFTVNERSEPIRIPFVKKDIDDCGHSNNATERRTVEDMIHEVFESLDPRHEKKERLSI